MLGFGGSGVPLQTRAPSRSRPMLSSEKRFKEEYRPGDLGVSCREVASVCVACRAGRKGQGHQDFFIRARTRYLGAWPLSAAFPMRDAQTRVESDSTVREHTRPNQTQIHQQ